MKLRAGFTLLELLAVIGLVAVLVAVGFPASQAMRQNAALGGSAQELVSILRQVQGQAIAGQNNVDQRVRSMNLTTYQVETGTSTISHVLASGVTFTANWDITFQRRLGTTSGTTITLSIGGSSKNIVVSPTGVITLQ